MDFQIQEFARFESDDDLELSGMAPACGGCSGCGHSGCAKCAPLPQ